MPLQIADFATMRPFLYHLTDARNLASIRRTYELSPAAEIMRNARRLDLLRRKRANHEPVEVDGQTIWLRDQAPLHRGNIEFADGYTFEALVERLNGMVFFWPGKNDGPISYGIRHFERYRNEEPVIIRSQSQLLIAQNPRNEPFFGRYNSGSPRCSNGNKSPRGPNTFVTAGNFHETASRIVEVTFSNRISLPDNAQYSSHPNGPWRKL